MKEEVFYSAEHDMLFIVFLYTDTGGAYNNLTLAQNFKGYQGLNVMLDVYGDLDYIGDF